MKRAEISELKSDLGKYLAYVRRGGVVRVYDRGRAVAELVPLGSGPASGAGSLEGVLAELEGRGVVRRGRGTLPSDFLTRPLPKATQSVVDALLDERRHGR